jgi:hypothetical protein
MDVLKEMANALNTNPDDADRKLRDINSQYLRGDAFTTTTKAGGGEAIPHQMVWPFPDDNFNVSHPVVHIIIM